MKETMKIHLSSFCGNRQTKESAYTHWEISDIRLIELAVVEAEAGRTKAGYRDGVVLVSIDPAGFYTGVIELHDGDKLIGEFKSRREGETPRVSINADRNSYPPLELQKQQAALVEVVLYSHDTLVENNENETDADYEIVSVNGHPTDEPAPIAPETLMHNHFGSDGGTDTGMSAEQFEEAMRESFNYWKNKAMITAE